MNFHSVVCKKSAMLVESGKGQNQGKSSRRLILDLGGGFLSLFRHSKGRKSRTAKSPQVSKIYPVELRSGPHDEYASGVDQNSESFHRAAGTILLVAQFFGILPINYVGGPSTERFSFRRLGPRAIYAYAILLGLLVMAAISFVHLLATLNAKSLQTNGGISDATVGAVFYGNILVGNFIFLLICPKWISIQSDWRAMEILFDNRVGRNWKRPALRWRFLLMGGTILGLALTEHVLSMMNNVPANFWSESHTLEDFLIVYTNKSHHFIIQHIKYNFIFGLFIFVISKIATFIWNFTDLFIMLVATGIAERYKSLNAYLISVAPSQVSALDWHRFREKYAVLSTLVKKIDKEISGIILISFINNIYFICLQLLNGLSPSSSNSSIVNSIYFFGSFIFLIGRTVAVTLLTARINDQCKVILPVLYNCPSLTYCLEAQRLQYQIATDDVALTGHRFFAITRNFMLAVAGAIVTYEVVLLQFNVALQRSDNRTIGYQG